MVSPDTTPTDRRPSLPGRVTRGILALGLTLGGVLVATPAAADVDDFTIESFDADMTLSRGDDGHAELTVVETIVARFPDADQNKGLIRAIPDEDRNVPYDTQIVSVTDGSGAEIPHEIEEDGDFLEVATGDDSYVRGEQTYVITYTQRDTVRAFDDTDSDEFYRDINGTGWDQPFEEVTARLTVEGEPAASLTGESACYAGVEGETGTCTLDETPSNGAQAVFESSASDLPPGGNLTVAIGFERGTFTPGEVQLSGTEQFAVDASPALQAGSGVAIAAALASIGAAIVARRRERDAAGEGLEIVQYDAPREVSVMEAAHLVGRGGTGVPAAIVDLAVSNHLRIIDQDGAGVEYLAPSPDPHRQEVLAALFGATPAPGTRVKLGGDTQELAKRLQALSGAQAARLRDAGLTEQRRQGLIGTATIVAGVALLVSVFAMIFSAIGETVTWLGPTAFGATVLAVIVVLGLWRTRDRVTDAGAPLRDHLFGLRRYLQLAEADRIRTLQGPDTALRSPLSDAEVVHLYERLLPYAIIFGVEKQWAEVLETRVRETGVETGWFSHPSGFSSLYLLAAINATSSSTSSTATWSSSAGSSVSGGSFGGGFSGGGAGGGGGGGR